jgi:xanthine dehydrogenase molybdenum-binding subunit
MEREFSIVGKRLPRPDVGAKVTGAAIYTADVSLPGMLIARILRSPYPHAKILRVDASKAKKLPGVAAVITHEDVPKRRYNRAALTMALPPPVLAKEVQDECILNEKVRFVGEAVAAVAAKDIYTAEDALDLIEVEYEQLPAVFDLAEAQTPGAPVIHDGHERNIASTLSYPFKSGDVEKGFEQSDHVVEYAARTSKQKAAQLEPNASVAFWEPSGKVTVWSPCETPHLAKSLLSSIFGILEGRLRLITPAVGGGFGPRLSLTTEPLCMALAKATGRPVKLLTTREEDFFDHDSRTGQSVSVKMGVKKDGTITAIEAKIVSDSGAYMSHSGMVSGVNLVHTLGVFRCKNIAGEATVVYTNTPPCGGMRGYGNPEGAFVMQQTVDLAAERIGMDPVEFRLKNIRGVGEPSCSVPVPIESCGLPECIKKGCEAIGWKKKWHGWLKTREGRGRRGIGMGIATIVSGTGGFLLEQSNAYIKLNEDGSANLTVSPCEMGQGILGALCQIAAEVIGLRYEDVHVITGDTDITLFDIGSHASRSVVVIGNAVAAAAQKVKKQILEFAARRLQFPSDKLEINEGRVYPKAKPELGITLAEIARAAIYDWKRADFHIAAKGSFHPDTMSPSFQAGFAEVEVNTETGEVKVLKYVLAHDIGRAINPMTVEGQIEGGVTQSLGYALYEDLIIDMGTGETLTDSFETYKIPSFLDMPEIKVVMVEEENPRHAFGAKGVGESGNTNVASAIANAVYDAIGIRVDSLPMTPEKILDALKKNNRGR